MGRCLIAVLACRLAHCCVLCDGLHAFPAVVVLHTALSTTLLAPLHAYGSTKLSSLIAALLLRLCSRYTPMINTADVEMHRGSDGRLYMLDLARSMPPEDPHVSMHTHT
jgi:Clustered mitochondria